MSVFQNFNITRASVGTFLNANGIVQTVANNVPRVEYAYDYWDSNPPNLMELSEEVGSNNHWFGAGIDKFLNANTAPDNSNTATSIVATSTNNPRMHFDCISVKAGEKLTFSVHAKYDDNQWAAIAFQAFTGFSAFSSSKTAYFDIQNGLPGFTDAVSSKIQAVGNGWYRLWITDTADQDGVVRVSLRLAGGNNNTTVVVGKKILYWGVQLEKNDSQSLPYVKTTTIDTIQYVDSEIKKLGFLVEGNRTNLFSRTEDYGGTPWSVLNTVRTDNANTSVTGTQTASLLTDDGDNNLVQSFLRVTDNANTSNFILPDFDTNYCFSIFVKALRSNTAALRTFGFGSNNNTSEFDLRNGRIVDPRHLYHGIKYYGNGWWRVWIVFNPGSADKEGTIGVYYWSRSKQASDPNILTNGLNNMLVFGAQLEKGNFPSSYIFSQSATVLQTRQPDVCELQNFDTSSKGQGTLLLDWYNQPFINSNATLFALNETSSNLVMKFQKANTTPTDGQLNVFVTANAVNAATINVGPWPQTTNSYVFEQNEFNTLVFRYTSDNLEGSLDGSNVVSQTVSGNNIFGQGNNYVLRLGSSSNTDHSFSIIKRVAYWPVYFSADTLKTLSANSSSFTLTQTKEVVDLSNTSLFVNEFANNKQIIVGDVLNTRVATVFSNTVLTLSENPSQGLSNASYYYVSNTSL